jgi:hypothetical protein
MPGPLRAGAVVPQDELSALTRPSCPWRVQLLNTHRSGLSVDCRQTCRSLRRDKSQLSSAAWITAVAPSSSALSHLLNMRTSLLSLLTVALACVRSVHASSPCAGLPANSSDSPSGQFTLAAFNPTTNTSTPLYVHQIGASGYTSYSVVIVGAIISAELPTRSNAQHAQTRTRQASATPDTYFGSITLTNGT